MMLMTPAGARRGLSYALTIDDRCTACGACLATCPTASLLPAPRRPETVSRRCTGCLECVEICPRGAVSVVRAA